MYGRMEEADALIESLTADKVSYFIYKFIMYINSIFFQNPRFRYLLNEFFEMFYDKSNQETHFSKPVKPLSLRV